MYTSGRVGGDVGGGGITFGVIVPDDYQSTVPSGCFVDTRPDLNWAGNNDEAARILSPH
jgi:hypothetical protein